MLDCQCRHVTPDSNISIALTDVLPKGFHLPLCTGRILDWNRTLLMPVSIQSCECCPVDVDYSMLCHTHYNRIPAWSVQWAGTASKVPLSPPDFK